MNVKDFENLTFNTSDKENRNFFNIHGFTNTTYFTTESSRTMIKENNDISF